MRRFILALLASLAATACGSGGSDSTGTQSPDACGVLGSDPACHTLAAGGTTRAYLLHVPSNFPATGGALVVALHGSEGSGLRLSETSGLNTKADQAGFAVAYPYALVANLVGFTEWNQFFNRSFSNPPDDVGFLRQLIVSLTAQLHADPKKIYVAGLSNGGMMAHRAGVELSDLVAAIGVVEGTVCVGSVANVPKPLAPVSVVILHGDLDPTVPYCNAPPQASQEETFNYWAGPQGDACSAVTPSAPLCDAQGNVTSVTTKRATGCAGNVEVQFYKLTGGVHLWYTIPLNDTTRTPYNASLTASTGVTTDDILWNFFAAHPKT